MELEQDPLRAIIAYAIDDAKEEESFKEGDHGEEADEEDYSQFKLNGAIKNSTESPEGLKTGVHCEAREIH